MAAPKFAPKLGSALGPMFKSTVRGVYKLGQKTKEFVAETNEHVQDIVAEVDAETKGKPAPAKDATLDADEHAKRFHGRFFGVRGSVAAYREQRLASRLSAWERNCRRNFSARRAKSRKRSLSTRLNWNITRPGACG